MPLCLIGLGSNQGSRRENLQKAVARLAAHPRIELLAQSTWLETAAVGGPAGQPPFLNGALKLDTSLDPLQLFECLLQIEIQLGRRREERWGPRTIDLDLLLYGEEVLNTPSLTLPHPRMAWRRFVLEPAVEAASEMVHPTIGWSIARLLEHINTSPPYVAVTGGIAAGKTRLAERLASALPARPIVERPDWARLDSFYADPAGQGWDTEMGFLEQRARLLRSDAVEWAERDAGTTLRHINSRGLTAPGELSKDSNDPGGIAEHSPGAVSPRLLATREKTQPVTVPFFRRWTVSDFWFDQSAAFARAWLPADRIGAFMQRYEQLRPAVAQPRLIVLLDSPAETTLARVRGRGRSCERRLTAEQLERIRRAVAEQAGRPGLGPVLRCSDDGQGTVIAEVLAAARGTD